MTSEPPADDIKRIWRDQQTERTTMSLEEIRKKAEQFHRRVRNRNLREYIAAAVVVPAFGVLAWRAQGWMGKTGSVLVIVAALFVVWQLHKRGSARTPPQAGSAMDLIGFHLGELTRQRDAAQTVWRWYLAPFVPGTVLMLLGRYFQVHAPGRTIEWDHQVIVLSAVVFALVFVIGWLVNALGASRLQRQIDALGKARSE